MEHLPSCDHPMPDSDDQKPTRFGGSKLHALDEKKRITIPATWRKKESSYFLHLGREFVKMTPPETFYATAERLASKVQNPREQRNMIRYFYSTATEIKLDAQGRVTIPDEMCKAVGLSEEVMLSGTGDRIEIWPPAKWADFERLEGERIMNALEEAGE